MKKVLTIAGSDCSGGAGIQADIKTITAHRLYAMSAITALTAQNTMGVAAISECSPEFFRQQLDCIFTDIVPDATKIGMAANAQLIEIIADALIKYEAKNIVLDPVMISTSGSALLKQNAVAMLKERLFPLARLVTPNIPEAAELSGIDVENLADMERAGFLLAERYGCAVLVKGGHGKQTANDLLCEQGESFLFEGERVDSQNTHGTGCTLSAAIACGLAEGKALKETVASAKKYLTGALKSRLDIGKGSGPVDHCWALKNKLNIKKLK